MELFFSDKAKSQDQDLLGNQRQRGAHANLDGIDCDARFAVPPIEIDLRWSLSNLADLLRHQLFVYRDLFAWLNDPFEAPPALETEFTMRSCAGRGC